MAEAGPWQVEQLPLLHALKPQDMVPWNEALANCPAENRARTASLAEPEADAASLVGDLAEGLSLHVESAAEVSSADLVRHSDQCPDLVHGDLGSTSWESDACMKDPLLPAKYGHTKGIVAWKLSPSSNRYDIAMGEACSWPLLR